MSETTFEIIKNERTGFEIKKLHHRSGLTIFLAPMKGFVQTTAIFSTNYGSIDNCFKTTEDEDFVNVPDGIAHYLEHKLFENEDCNVFELYANTGADANAMTGFENTDYLFSCTENFNESLKILLDFVQKPYFTQENVDKERGIIGQEISMTEDLPKRCVFFNLLGAMYKNHPVRIDIAGTQASIEKITPELLYKCYGAFYNLHNMALAVAGSFDEDEVIRICDEHLLPCKDMHLEVRYPDEPVNVASKHAEEVFGVGVPLFSLGFKCKPYSGEELLKKEIEASILMSMLFDKMSPLNKLLNDNGLVNDELSTEVFDGKGFFSLVISGESEQPQMVLDEILKAIENAKSSGLDREEFDLLKKSEYGAAVRELNHPESCAANILAYHFHNLDAFASERCIAAVTFEDITAALDEFFGQDNYAVSIIR